MQNAEEEKEDNNAEDADKKTERTYPLSYFFDFNFPCLQIILQSVLVLIFHYYPYLP